MRELKMRKATTLSLMALIAMAMILPMIPQAFAKHNATLEWVETGTDTLMRPEFPNPLWPWLNFTVYNWEDSPNAIVKFKFLIPKTAEGYAKFKYWESVIRVSGWSATPDEFDNDGWATVIIFETKVNPIEADETVQFDVKFTDSRVTVCKHIFMIYTIDDGSPSPETKPHELYLIVDPDPPNLVMIRPTSEDGTSPENPIYAIFDPYPLHWYMRIEFTADDYKTGEHDTGISLVQVFMDGKELPDFRRPASGYYEPPLKKAIPPYIAVSGKLWDLPKGWHTIKVVAWDGARNPETFTHEFYFEVPTYFKITPDEGTVGRYDNVKNPVTGEWSGNISDIYLEKQLGTNVTAEGLEPPSPLVGFTPNSWVNIYVYHPLYEGRMLVRKDVPTNSRGVFKTWFLFPKAPQGIYKVEAVDAKGITDYTYFTVVPEIIYKPKIVTGPAIIEAIASGLTSDGDVEYFMADDTDALLTVNMHTLQWYSDKWGVLWTYMAYKQGFLLPLLENGIYNIKLGIVEGAYWNGITSYWDPLYLEVSNEVYVANDFATLLSAIDELEVKLDDIKPVIKEIKDNTVTIITILGEVTAKLDDLDAKIIQIKGDMAVIKTMLGEIEAKLDDLDAKIIQIKDDIAIIITTLGEIEAKLDDVVEDITLIKEDTEEILGDTEEIIGHAVNIKTTVGDIKGTVTSVKNDVATIKTDVGSIKTDVGSIKGTTADITEATDDIKEAADSINSLQPATVALSLIAAISAIAAAVMVLRKVYMK